MFLLNQSQQVTKAVRNSILLEMKKAALVQAVKLPLNSLGFAMQKQVIKLFKCKTSATAQLRSQTIQPSNTGKQECRVSFSGRCSLYTRDRSLTSQRLKKLQKSCKCLGVQSINGSGTGSTRIRKKAKGVQKMSKASHKTSLRVCSP